MLILEFPASINMCSNLLTSLGAYTNFLREIDGRRTSGSASAEHLPELLTSLASVSSSRHTAIIKAFTPLCAFYDRQADWTTTGFVGLIKTSAKARATTSAGYVTELKAALAELESVLSYPITSPVLEREEEEDDEIEKKAEDGVKDRLELSTTNEPTATISASPSQALTAIAGAGTDPKEPFSYLHVVYLRSLETTILLLINLLRAAIKVEEQPVRVWLPGKQNQESVAQLEKAAAAGPGSAGIDEKDGSGNIEGPSSDRGDDNGDLTLVGQERNATLGGIQAVLGGSGSVPAGEDNPTVISGISTPLTGMSIVYLISSLNLIPHVFSFTGSMIISVTERRFR